MQQRPAFVLFFLMFVCFCKGQVPVSKEPRHHPVFENEYVRLLDVHVVPGDTTQFHIHQTPSVFIMLSPVKTGSEVQSEDPADAAPIGDNNLYFTGFYRQPRIHRVWNSDTAEFHVMDVELLRKTYGTIAAPVEQQGVQLLFDEQPVRGYRVTIVPSASIALPARKTPVLLVALTNSSATVNQKVFSKKGDFLFLSANQSIAITATTDEARFALLEFK